MYGNRFFDYVFQTNRRIFFHQRMQLRHQPARYQPLPCQCHGSTRATALVFRSINSKYPKFETLNLPPILKDIALRKRGLVIFVGGTGSGKSTSLASLIDYRNENSFDHIITIEDPIEFIHQHKNCIITQREIGVDTENWPIALKNTLRQAPDVILIGEIRDRETMDYAISFAETGHLCMATLHANSTNQALDRIINFFPEERRTQLLTDLSLNLQAFISQRLIPRESGRGRVAAVEVFAQFADYCRLDSKRRSPQHQRNDEKINRHGYDHF